MRRMTRGQASAGSDAIRFEHVLRRPLQIRREAHRLQQAGGADAHRLLLRGDTGRRRRHLAVSRRDEERGKL